MTHPGGPDDPGPAPPATIHRADLRAHRLSRPCRHSAAHRPALQPEAPIDITLHPVIVCNRPASNSTGYPLPLPSCADPAGLRIMRADAVLAGDFYLGDCEQRAKGRFLAFGVHVSAAFRSAPASMRTGRAHRLRTVIALDGESFVWRPEELVMVIPRALLGTGPRSRPGSAAPGHS